MKTDANAAGLSLRTGTEPSTTQQQGTERPPDEEAERFASLLRVPAAGAAILAGMGAGPPPATSPAAKLVEDLAERVLVGDGGEGGGQGVHVLAKEVGIPGLEVAVRREAGGLVVELIAPHPADLALLRSGAAELSARLEARFGGRAEVRVRRRDTSEQRDGGERQEP